MDNDIVIMAACDQRYFLLCLDLITSLKNAFGSMPRMRVLDLGLAADQVAVLARNVEAVIVPDWDVGGDLNLPTWYRAMTARPFLPRYAGDAAVIAWIDCDAWVQRTGPLEALIAAARDGALAIVEERFGKGFSVDVPAGMGVYKTLAYDLENVKAGVRSCYADCFGQEAADAFADLPCFNSGVFALRADSPSWKVWQDILGPSLARHFHFLAEQTALNLGIRRGLIPVAKQPQEANFTCHLELPWYSAKLGAFTFPGDETRVLGVVHLCDVKSYPLLKISQFPDGRTTPMSLTYSAAQNFIRRPG